MNRIAYRSKRRPIYPNHKKPTILLLIDAQIDFCTPKGSLYVPGAEKDSVRVANMIRNHIDDIDEIFMTMDTHHRNHIAHSAFWSSTIDGEGKGPDEFAPILSTDVNVKWFPRDPSLRKHCKQYCADLEALEVKRTLTIWPEHCLIGTEGHCVDPIIEEAVAEWTRKHTDCDVSFVHKGMNCLTEMYSAIRADVPNIDPQTQTNHELLADIRRAGKLLICGEASSHCVNYTARDIVDDWEKHNDKNVSNIFILKDGSSPVSGFEQLAHEFHLDMMKKQVSIISIADAFN